MKPDSDGYMQYFRFITPILVTIGLFMMNNINAKVEDIQQKLWTHLTNDEMHSPKSIIVTKAEFSIYQEMRQRQMVDMQTAINARIDNIRISVDKIIDILDKRK